MPRVDPKTQAANGPWRQHEKALDTAAVRQPGPCAFLASRNLLEACFTDKSDQCSVPSSHHPQCSCEGPRQERHYKPTPPHPELWGQTAPQSLSTGIHPGHKHMTHKDLYRAMSTWNCSPENSLQPEAVRTPRAALESTSQKLRQATTEVHQGLRAS